MSQNIDQTHPLNSYIPLRSDDRPKLHQSSPMTMCARVHDHPCCGSVDMPRIKISLSFELRLSTTVVRSLQLVRGSRGDSSKFQLRAISGSSLTGRTGCYLYFLRHLSIIKLPSETTRRTKSTSEITQGDLDVNFQCLVVVTSG